MTLPALLKNRLSVPVIGAPMFLVSFPPLVTAQCMAGVIGAFPHVNARPSAQLDQWLTKIETDLRDYKAAHPAATVAPHAVNLIVHRTNARYEPDLEIIVTHRVPLVITCLGDPRRAAEAVHGYGGIVFCDVVNAQHARKAIEAGADGLICVGGGAGGHASSQSAFSLVREVREFWDGCLVLGGSISDGHQIRAAEVLGADLAYMGTRFIATRIAGAGRLQTDDRRLQRQGYHLFRPLLWRVRQFPAALDHALRHRSGNPAQEIAGHERAGGCRSANMARHLERGARHRNDTRRAERSRTRRPARGRLSRGVRGAGGPALAAS